MDFFFGGVGGSGRENKVGRVNEGGGGGGGGGGAAVQGKESHK